MRSSLPLWKGCFVWVTQRYHPPTLLLLLLLFSFQTLLAQSPVRGKIMSGDLALANVTVQIKGTNTATQTDNDGNFSIVAPPNATLVISAIGYATQEVAVNNRTSVNIALTNNTTQLDQVVVVGYGTQRRATVTGAIANVSGKTVAELPVPNISQALQGRVAGVQVTNNGSPGTQPIVRIRGISSISFASDPLYVVDGFPTGDLSTIDTRDIESVDVLKDASAAAIYGSRATNGVIMITTKKGRRDGKVHVSLDSYYGIQEVTSRLDLLDTEGFKKYAQAYRGSLPGRLLPPEVDKPIYAGANQTYGQTNTDWQDAYFRTGTMTQHNIGLSGGNDVSRFYTSAGYMDQQGTAPSVAYRRYNFRINSDHNFGRFTFGQNLYGAYGDQGYDNNETGSRTNLVNVIRMMPHMPVFDPTSNGGYRGVNSVLDGGDPTNPVEDAALKNPGSRRTAKILGTAFLEVNFTRWLKFRSTFGIDYANGLDYRFSPIFNNNGTVAGSSATVATVTNNRSASTVLLFTEQLSFDKTFGDHHVNAIAVYEQQGQKIRNENASGQQPSNELRTLNNASNVAVQTLYGENTLMSVLGRVNYDYRSKYLVSAAIRRDGLSVWAPGKKWATFPSASIGWRIDQEEFMKGASKISELKLRAGYGVTGLNGVVLGNTPWLVTVNANSAAYPFGNSLTAGPASSIQRLGNRDLEWEKTKQLNIGVDLGLLRNRITLSAEYFNRKTDNLILSVPLPPSMGFITSTVSQNIGAMENNGVELQLGYNDREGDFKWNANANFSAIKNRVTRMAPGVSNIEAGSDADFGADNITRTQVGEAIQSFYGWVVEGIFQDSADVRGHAKQRDGTGPGDLKFADLDKNGVIDREDRRFLGSFLPKYTYAFNLGANYRNFDVSVFFQGVQGNKIYNATRVITEGMVRFFNAGTQVLNAWTPANRNTNIPRAASSDPNQNARPSTRFLEDGSYLRLKNLILAYNVPGNTLQSLTKGTVSNFRIYVSAQNLLTLTDYSGYDPEVGNRTPGSSLTNGIDFAVYPQPKSYQIGVQVNF
ncbi:TonB-linked outer membrane protein, SusC/RagA family [Cnuella takakiae]|uniref:TonB-linked outer membrane protein, SusC/RagA family n=1 Tax=Cnuella takakiae TaxID=1302690 RepID=A0A1M5CPU7_9BACT|nr:TonB-dependent receptor [Cnuella takakiae]OLY91901.1 SusC/RagA family TonB-linked outer membrane protein [Cnuella takakiae]SHF56731.1 TonB-linked outer membrane protein, SusC/RagA family [Cnuella takakiae]